MTLLSVENTHLAGERRDGHELGADDRMGDVVHILRTESRRKSGFVLYTTWTYKVVLVVAEGICADKMGTSGMSAGWRWWGTRTALDFLSGYEEAEEEESLGQYLGQNRFGEQ